MRPIVRVPSVSPSVSRRGSHPSVSRVPSPTGDTDTDDRVPGHASSVSRALCRHCGGPWFEPAIGGALACCDCGQDRP